MSVFRNSWMIHAAEYSGVPPIPPYASYFALRELPPYSPELNRIEILWKND